MKTVGAALACYASENDGRLPGSWEQLYASGIIAATDEYPKGFDLLKRAEHAGVPVRDRDCFTIAFGARLDELQVTEAGILGKDGTPVDLVAFACGASNQVNAAGHSKRIVLLYKEWSGHKPESAPQENE